MVIMKQWNSLINKHTDSSANRVLKLIKEKCLLSGNEIGVLLTSENYSFILFKACENLHFLSQISSKTENLSLTVDFLGDKTAKKWILLIFYWWTLPRLYVGRVC